MFGSWVFKEQQLAPLTNSLTQRAQAKMAAAQAELLAFQVSPFTLKEHCQNNKLDKRTMQAQWGLQLLTVKYKQSAYQPALSYWAELPLRLRLRKLTGHITAPILFTNDGSGVLMDSFQIVQWGAKQVPLKSSMLLPAGQEAEVTRWNGLSNDLLRFYRRLLRDLLVSSQEARAKLGAGPGNEAADAALLGICRRLATKFADDNQFTVDKATAILQELRAALHAHGLSTTNTAAYILGPEPCGSFSYADLAMAVSMDMLTQPCGLPSSVATPLAGDVPAFKQLQNEFADLVAWRKAVWCQHMPATVAVVAPAAF